MTTKQFSEGELLTAADVNNFLVNDDEALGATAETVIKSYQDTLSGLDSVQAKIPQSPQSPKGKEPIYAFTPTDWETGNTSLRDWTFLFDDSIEIVYVTTPLTVTNQTAKIDGSRVLVPKYGTGTSGKPMCTIYFKIKEQS